jgi:pimeloyl-ACP methyl ester carboxylesterase
VKVLAIAAFAIAAVAVASTSAGADVLDTPTPAPVWTKTVGIMRVERFGSGNPALILVPGLGCGTWVWRDTIAREVKRHAVYAVTLAGFDGVPLTTDAGLDAADTSLATLIATEKLDRPVLIGHSLGGFATLRFGTEHPALLRGVVSVDGLPVFPALAQSTPDQRAAAASRMGSAIAAQSPGEYEASQGQIMRDYVVDPAIAARATTLVERSDQKAIALYAGQLFAQDLRPQLPKLTLPGIIVAPIPALPLPSYLPPELAQLTQDQRHAGMLAFYGTIIAGAPSLQIVPIDGARHFAMLDQPDAFATALDTFIASLH